MVRLKILGIPRSTLDLKIKQLDIKKHLPVNPLIELPDFWHFLKFCHSNFFFEPCFQ